MNSLLLVSCISCLVFLLFPVPCPLFPLSPLLLFSICPCLVPGRAGRRAVSHPEEPTAARRVEIDAGQPSLGRSPGTGVSIPPARRRLWRPALPGVGRSRGRVPSGPRFSDEQSVVGQPCQTGPTIAAAPVLPSRRTVPAAVRPDTSQARGSTLRFSPGYFRLCSRFAAPSGSLPRPCEWRRDLSLFPRGPRSGRFLPEGAAVPGESVGAKGPYSGDCGPHPGIHPARAILSAPRVHEIYAGSTRGRQTGLPLFAFEIGSEHAHRFPRAVCPTVVFSSAYSLLLLVPQSIRRNSACSSCLCANHAPHKYSFCIARIPT